MNGKSNLQRRLAVLLREAERARGDYEKSLGHRDDDRPDWYATYIAERLSDRGDGQSAVPAVRRRA